MSKAADEHRPLHPGRQKKSLAAAIGIVVLIVGYVLLRPVIEKRFGIELPDLFENDQAAQKQEGETGAANAERQQGDADQSTSSQAGRSVAEGANNGAASVAKESSTRDDDSNRDPSSRRAGQLRDLGGGVKESPAGLRYGPGSFEGHRLDHVLRHARDDPSRPIHGVFDGDQDDIIAVIDEAYVLARDGGRQVRTERDGPRTIHNVDLGRKIGFIGGQTGRRENRPPATGIRLVVEGRNVITAFPIRP